MAQANIYQGQTISPLSFSLVVALHAAALTAAMAWKMDVVPKVLTETKTFWVEDEKAKPDPVDPRPQPQQDTSQVDRTEAIVPIPTPNPPIPIPRPEPPTFIGDTGSDRSVLPPPEPVKTFEPARAKGNLAALITSDDYPDIARRNDESGSVRARLDVAANGKVSGCSIIASSGSSVLDKATCRILKSRGRFVPARDSNGQAIGDSVETPRITWRLTEAS